MIVNCALRHARPIVKTIDQHGDISTTDGQSGLRLLFVGNGGNRRQRIGAGGNLCQEFRFCGYPLCFRPFRCR